jgi:hypothetical protein
MFILFIKEEIKILYSTVSFVNLCSNVVIKFISLVAADAVSSKQKEAVWQRLTEDFCRQSTGVSRTCKQLQDCFKNMKATTRKNLAADKVSCSYNIAHHYLLQQCFC